MLIAVRAKLLQGQQTELATEEPHPQLLVVVVVLPLELHGPQSHANPRVKFLEHPTASRQVGGEVMGRPPNHSVKFRDARQVQVVVAFGQLPHLGLGVAAKGG